MPNSALDPHAAMAVQTTSTVGPFKETRSAFFTGADGNIQIAVDNRNQFKHFALTDLTSSEQAFMKKLLVDIHLRAFGSEGAVNVEEQASGDPDQKDPAEAPAAVAARTASVSVAPPPSSKKSS